MLAMALIQHPRYYSAHYQPVSYLLSSPPRTPYSSSHLLPWSHSLPLPLSQRSVSLLTSQLSILTSSHSVPSNLRFKRNVESTSDSLSPLPSWPLLMILQTLSEPLASETPNNSSQSGGESPHLIPPLRGPSGWQRESRRVQDM